MSEDKCKYAVSKFHRPKQAMLEMDVLARFKEPNDAIFFAKNVHKVTKSEIESIRVYDVDSMKEIKKFDGAVLTN